MNDHGEGHELEKIVRELKDINRTLSDIDGRLAWLESISDSLQCICRALYRDVIDFSLAQISEGGFTMAITGVPVGGTGTFQISLVPPNGVPLTSGPTVTVDDTLVTLGPVGTPQPLQFTAAVSAADTSNSFNLTVMGVNGAGTIITHTFNVPILAAPPVQVTDFGLDQVS